MEHQKSALAFSLRQVGPSFGYATISIPELYVKKLYTQASFAQQSGTHTHGFARGTTPLAYIEKNFQPHLLEHIKEFFFKYFVIDWLYQEIAKNKLLLAAEPRLTDVNMQPGEGIEYNFSITLAQPIPLQGWKRLSFKAPKRKNYKDLDKQVKIFLAEEQTACDAYKTVTILAGDWVHFSVCILDTEHVPLFENHEEHLWIKVGQEEGDLPFQNLLIGKKKGDVFISTNAGLQEYFSSHIETHYPFRVTIIGITPQAYLDVELFKKHFKIKTTAEIHLKLIEVFSYRNDISQRRSTVEETLKTLLSKHFFETPNHLILRQQKEILEAIYENPDYQVYKMQSDFQEKVKKMATKQVKEIIFIHQLAMHEGISVDSHDIMAYLNLTKRPRTKEFIYFTLPGHKTSGQEIPISSAILSRSVLKEKTLNYAIHNLTKQKTRNL